MIGVQDVGMNETLYQLNIGKLYEKLKSTNIHTASFPFVCSLEQMFLIFQRSADIFLKQKQKKL